MEKENIIIDIEQRIFVIRGQRVMLDRDLAQLYGVTVKALNQAVKRNIERFPNDFMFRLSKEEWEDLRSQIVTANVSKVRFTPFAFTEYGTFMLANVLNSSTATRISIEIIRVFNKLRQYAMLQNQRNTEVEELRKILMLHIDNTDNRFSECNERINKIIEVLNNLIEKPRETKQIGFKTK